MTLFQSIYFVLLLTGSGAALLCGNRKRLIAILWANFIATMTFAGTPFSVGIADLSCAAALVYVGGKRAYAIALLFAAMVPLYLFATLLGNYATYTIVDVLAYCQVLILGGGGFGKLIGSTKSLAFYTSLRTVRSAYNIHNMEEGRRASRHSKPNPKSHTVKGLDSDEGFL